MGMHCSSAKCGSGGKGCCGAKCFKIGVLIVAGVAALGAVVMFLWNWLMPSLFIGAQPVSYLQALGILLLSKILFGGFRGGCHGGKHRQRWESMTPEEREQMKRQFKSRWCRSKGEESPAGEAPKAD